MQAFQQISMSVGVLLLLCLTLWFLRRNGLAQVNTLVNRKSPNRQLQPVERLSLTAQHSLHLVRMGERLILVGVSPSGCQLLESVAALPAEGGS